MFTGIVVDVGRIEKIDKRGDWVFEITGSNAIENLDVGSSISCNGICLTVIEKMSGSFKVQLSTETLDKTTARRWKVGDIVNLEPSLKFGDEMGGHLVAGHVDGVARIIAREDENDSIRFRFEIPFDFTAFLAPKGSIALDGISLTINEVEGTIFGVNIIPHTQQATTIGEKHIGDLMNFEIDLIARYVNRLLEQRKGLA